MKLLSGLAGLVYRNATSWPLPGKVLLGCGVVCLLVLLGNTFYLSASREQLRQQEAQEVALREQIAEKTKAAAQLKTLTRQFQATQGAFAQLLRHLPLDIEVPGLLEDVTRLGNANGLELGAIKLLDEQSRPLYIELPMEIGLVGGFHDVAGFISGLGGLSRIVTVQGFTVRADESRVRLKLLAKTYRYNHQDGGDLRALMADVTQSSPPRLAYDPASLRDPFQPPFRQLERVLGRPAAAPDPGRQRGFLEGFAIEQFEMVGTVSRGAQTFALLRAASAVYRLAIGDYLGPDYGRVTAIDDAHIELAELFPGGQGAWLERSRTLALNVNS
ncbi:type 4a pilus biogenesis protein PilO [Pseudomonas sp. CCM 7891]|uniref:Type 4a pilus biogenesis protein PilO n=1 Tax=Pseudomonas karstica TaxID=1055468 RepID=A0A7X2RP85_9PSED|nr:pilus assembly protein PilP [Pseudomonas karstica]MTD18571.1 type 4a pilus biogenesis protein PilO [Pseudomonas karstica]